MLACKEFGVTSGCFLSKMDAHGWITSRKIRSFETIGE
jgi:hypothetical protein